MSPHAGWDRDSLWDLWSAALCEPHCQDPDCSDCHPSTTERAAVRASNNTAAAVIAVLMIIIAIGVILA